MLNPGQYFREVGRELRKVTWPTRKQTIEMTVLVVGVSLIIGAYIGALDYVFREMMAQTLLLK